MLFRKRERSGALTKADIVDSVHRYLSCLDLCRIDSVNVVNSLFEIMKRSLENGEKVLISGFGTFSVKSKKERKGRNPRTGEEIKIPAKKVVKFYRGKDLEL